MSEKFPLQPLLDLANTRMDEVTRELGELIASERSSQQKLELLQGYRNEYSERFIEAARSGIGSEAMRNYTNFLSRIDEAIEIQQQVVKQSRLDTSQGQQQWVEQHTKVRAFDTLSQRFQSELARKTSRQEQRASDEHSSRKFRDHHEDIS
ncbi:MAG: flagellar export protein FliJ [Betaproteobacteria bacterium]|jgi:flagellar FliJ protein|nr:flagellar export protein FliJ [Betaproteobacteria bacterium]